MPTPIHTWFVAPKLLREGLERVPQNTLTSLGSTDAKQAVGSRVRLMGNVHPSAVMLQGTTADVRSATLASLREAHDNPKGFIVASGCSLPTETPFANIHAMLDTVREVGWPVKAEYLI